ncbi:hypothetical protein [Acinetobacter soli]|uniref:hypothetical protein n=1 Tax=Acinetobacter soli TaxID=487316 RepID=UPI001250B581|nr:hypothetical protein [Acinetobacter soli]
MDISEMQAIGLIREPKFFDVLLPGEQPRTLDEYLRRKRIREEAERAAKESVQRIFKQIKQESKPLDEDLSKLLSENITDLF